VKSSAYIRRPWCEKERALACALQRLDDFDYERVLSGGVMGEMKSGDNWAI
jgi:hypothetical protein